MNWLTIILTALPSAILGGFITHLLTIRRENKKKKIASKGKELMIKDDLRNKANVFNSLKKSYEILNQKIKNNLSLDYPSDIFQDLHTDVYQSVSNPDLHQIFKEDFFILVNVYKAIDHLKEFSPYKIKMKFISILDEYGEKHKDNFNQAHYKEFIKPYIEYACGQIEMNFVTINDLFKEIDFLIENIENPKGRAKNPKRKEIEYRKTFENLHTDERAERLIQLVSHD